MIYYEWKIKIDGQIQAQGFVPEQGNPVSELELYLMQYQHDWKDKLEITIKKKETQK